MVRLGNVVKCSRVRGLLEQKDSCYLPCDEERKSVIPCHLETEWINSCPLLEMSFFSSSRGTHEDGEGMTDLPFPLFRHPPSRQQANRSQRLVDIICVAHQVYR